MSSFEWPPSGGGGGVPIYTTLSAFPAGTEAGDLAVAADTGNIYEWNGSAWVLEASPSGAGPAPGSSGDLLYNASGVVAADPNFTTNGTGTLSAVGLTLSGLTPSEAVVTNGSKALASLAYTSANTPSTLVERDASGNFSAGTITASLSGNATTSTTATNATNVATTATNSTNATFFPTFVASATSGNQGIDTSTGLVYNPTFGLGIGTSTMTGPLNIKALGNGNSQGFNMTSPNGSITWNMIGMDTDTWMLYDGANVMLKFVGSLAGTGQSAPNYKWDVNINTTNSAGISAIGNQASAITNHDNTNGDYSPQIFVNSSSKITSAILGVHETQTTTPNGHLSFYTAASGTLSEALRLTTSQAVQLPAYTTAGVITNNTSGLLASIAPGTSGNVLTSSGGVWVSAAAFTAVAPTLQKFTSGSGTYTRPTSPRVPLYIRVRMVGGGGGGVGGGAGASDGSNGGDTTFGTTLLVAGGGGGAPAGVSATPPSGGTASLGTGPIGTAIQGASGTGPGQPPGTTGLSAGPSGASSPFGGAGGGGGGVIADGFTAIANSGSGGGGSGAGSSQPSGASGAAGGYVDAIITSPSSTYAYAIGAGGAGGPGGSFAGNGGDGGSGYIEVTEYYQ